MINNKGSIRWSRVMGWGYVAPGGSRSKQKRKKNGERIFGNYRQLDELELPSLPRFPSQCGNIREDANKTRTQNSLSLTIICQKPVFHLKFHTLAAKFPNNTSKPLYNHFWLNPPRPHPKILAKKKKPKHIKSGWYWNSNQKLREGFDKCIRTLKDQLAYLSKTFFFLSFFFLPACFDFLPPVAAALVFFPLPLAGCSRSVFAISDPLLLHNHNCSVTRGPLQLSWSAVTLWSKITATAGCVTHTDTRGRQ